MASVNGLPGGFVDEFDVAVAEEDVHALVACDTVIGERLECDDGFRVDEVGKYWIANVDVRKVPAFLNVFAPGLHAHRSSH